MTGTFDNWTKSVKLEKQGSVFQKTVDLKEPAGKIYYKVCSNLGNIRQSHKRTRFNNGSGTRGLGEIPNALRLITVCHYKLGFS